MQLGRGGVDPDQEVQVGLFCVVFLVEIGEGDWFSWLGGRRLGTWDMQSGNGRGGRRTHHGERGAAEKGEGDA